LPKGSVHKGFYYIQSPQQVGEAKWFLKPTIWTQLAQLLDSQSTSLVMNSMCHNERTAHIESQAIPSMVESTIPSLIANIGE
jgi:hypothetical protein